MLLLSAVVAVFYGRLLVGSTVFGCDTFVYVLGQKFLIRDQLLQGRLPALDPYILCGTPLLANITAGAIYPLNALLLVGTPLWGVNLSIFSHYWLAALAMYALLRRGFRLEPGSMPAERSGAAPATPAGTSRLSA